MLRMVFTCAFVVIASACYAEDYVRWRWFEYPDPFTVPKTTVECVKEASMHVPCPTWSNPGRMCRRSTCIGHAYRVEVLRVRPTFVVSGPNSGNEAVRKAVEGVAVACATKAVATGKAAAAATPSPEPGARVAAAIGSAALTFKACVSTITAVGIAGSIIRQLNFKIETPTHWARM